MDQLVPHGGNIRDVQAAVVGWLGGHLTRATAEQVNTLAGEIAHDIVMGGAEALGGIRGTITEFARTTGMQLNANGRAWIERTAQALDGIGAEIIQGAQDGWDAARRGQEMRTEGLAFDGENWREPVIDRAAGEPSLEDLLPDEDVERINRPDDDSMDGSGSGAVDPGTEETADASARMASGGGGPSSVSKETPISPYPGLTYGLQETHTTILPWVGWLTCAMAKGTSIPKQLKIRLNTPYDMLDVTMETEPAVGAVHSVGGFYGSISDDAKRGPTGVYYPYTFNQTATEATERPAWRDYWAALYDYYTVLGCEYEITVQNPNTANGSDIMIAVQKDVYSDEATSTGNVMPLDNIADIMAFKNIQYYNVPYNKPGDRNNITVIKGTYKPGSTKRNIINDGDVKTWVATSTTLPKLKEILTLNFVKHPMAFASVFNCNIQIRLKYIVQFKDLKQQARYPSVVTLTQDITTILNETNTNNNGLQRWA